MKTSILIIKRLSIVVLLVSVRYIKKTTSIETRKLTFHLVSTSMSNVSQILYGLQTNRQSKQKYDL